MQEELGLLELHRDVVTLRALPVHQHPVLLQRLEVEGYVILEGADSLGPEAVGDGIVSVEVEHVGPWGEQSGSSHVTAHSSRRPGTGNTPFCYGLCQS